METIVLPRTTSAVSDRTGTMPTAADTGEPGVARGTFTVEALRTLRAVHAREQEWLALERRCCDPYAAFQSYAWCEGWLRAYPDRDRPLVLMVRRGGRAVALLPLGVRRTLGLRILGPLGEPHTQLSGALVDAGLDDDLGREAMRLALAQAMVLSRADALAFGAVVAGSPLAQALAERCTRRPDPAEAVMALDWSDVADGASFDGALSKNRRRDVRRKRSMLAAHGPVRRTTLGPGDEGFAALVKEGLGLKRNWLRAQGLASLALDDRRTGDFLAGLPAVRGATRVEAERWRVGADTFAISINLTTNGPAGPLRHCYLNARDTRFEFASPGTLAHYGSMEDAASSGCAGYTFLGHPTPFKETWCNRRVPLQRYTHAFTPRGRTWLACWSEGLRPLLKRMLQGRAGRVVQTGLSLPGSLRSRRAGR